MENHRLLVNNDGSNSDSSQSRIRVRVSQITANADEKPHIASHNHWTYHHAVVFLLTFTSYLLLHATRKAFSNVKSLLEKEWTAFGDCHTAAAPAHSHSLYCAIEPTADWTKPVLFNSAKDAQLFMGTLDTIFMFFYAIGLFVSGFLGDRLPLVGVLCVGMSVSSIMVFLFGFVTPWTGYQQPWLYCLLWAVNGLAQSACWPTIVAIMANWFGRKGRGLILGLWSANASTGNIVGALLVSTLLGYGSAVALLVPAMMLLGGTLVNMFCLPASPADIFKIVPAMAKVSATADKGRHAQTPETSPFIDGVARQDMDFVGENRARMQRLSRPSEITGPRVKTAVGFLDAWKLPGVLPYSLAYACLKLVNYTLFFWLPFYLTDSLNWSRTLASKLSTLFDFGAILGGTLGGLLSDFLGYRSPVFSLMLTLAVPSLFVYRRYGTDHVSNAVLMLVMGFWIGGPANLLSAAISVDLGRQEALKDNTEALATVTGIIDGTGSIGAAAGQYLIGFIETHSGWQNVIYFLMAMLVLAVLCTAGLVVSEVRALLHKVRTKFLTRC